MENQPQSAVNKAGYFVLTLELLLIAAGAAWYFIYLKPAQPEPRPAFEAVAFAGFSPIGSPLTTQHSSCRDVMRIPEGETPVPQDAMVGDVVDQWGDYAPVAGQTVLFSPADPKLKPVVSPLRVTADKGQLRALTFGPGAWLEGKGDTTQKPFPMEMAPDAPGLTIVQLVRCRVEADRTLTTLRLSNQESGKHWATIRARPDGSFEALVGPSSQAISAPGPVAGFCVVSLTWDPRNGKGTCRLAARPEGGFPRQSKEMKASVAELEAADQMQLGDKLDAGGASNGTMDVLETVVFNRELSVKDVTRVEDWLYNFYFSGIPARGPFTWAAANLTASWGDDASWSGEGIPAANEQVLFTAAPKAEPVTIHLDDNRQIKSLTFSSASPSWTLAEGSLAGATLNITDGDTTWHEDIGSVAKVDQTIVNVDTAIGGFAGSSSDELTFLGDGGTVNFRKRISSRLVLGSDPDAARGMSYSLEAPNIVQSRLYIGFHDNPAASPVNSTVSTFLRVNQTQKTTADQTRVAGGGGNEWGVMTIQNKATWDQDKGALFVGYSGSNGTQNRSNGRIEIGHPGSAGTLTIGNDTTFEIGENGGTGVIEVNNGSLLIKAGNDTRTVLIGDNGSDQNAGGGNGTINLNADGNIWAGRNFTRSGSQKSGSGKFNFNGGLLKIGRASGNVTTDLIGPGITVTLNGPGARIDTNNNSTVLARDLSGPGGLEKLGNGTLTLSGKNSYKGDTKVTGGVLKVSGQALPAGGTLQLNGGKVELTGPASAAKLVFKGAAQAPGTWGATGSGPRTSTTRGSREAVC